MSHDLQLLRASSDDKGASRFKIVPKLSALIEILLLFGLLNIALSSDSEMFPQLYVLLLPLELIDLLLDPINQVLGNGVLGHSALADAHARV